MFKNSGQKMFVKKGFTAPVLKVSESGHVKKDDKAVIKIKHKKTEVSLTDAQYDEIFNAVLKDNRSNLNSQHPEVSLTDAQYDEIFNAVLKDNRSNLNSQHNTPGDDQSEFAKKTNENTPTNDLMEICHNLVKRSLSEEVCPETQKKQLKKPGTKTPPSKCNSLSALSPWGSHFGKRPSQATSILKELQESQSTLLNSSTLMSPDTTSTSDDEGCTQISQVSVRQLSQVSGYGSQNSQTRPAAKLSTDQRQRLEKLQELRNVGVWVYCCRPTCQKQRYLADVKDPQDVPEIWYCHMNSDPNYNSCKAEEQKLSPEEEDDMIYNEFTAGSLVWARVTGYPWWPAMVDDDPDLEQFYWLDDDDITVTFYHVVFFDEESVTRAWVTIKNISPYGKIGNSYKQKSARGIDFSRRILVAKEQANAALTLNTTERLKLYSFIARYTGPINTSSTKVKKTMKKYKLKAKAVEKEFDEKKSTKRGRKKREITVGDQVSNKVNKKKNSKEGTVKRKKEVNDEEASYSVTKKFKDNREKHAEADKNSELPPGSVNENPGEIECWLNNFMNNLPDNSQAENSISDVQLHNTEESLGSVIEPSQCRAEQSRLFQPTNADVSSAQHEDAVVPEENISQLSEPFEE